ncbi:hypothetical protein [Amycolatopsis coloradensis]|uniref:hypothetical protein n=1 Tax=Amycolatopsis coloradensis TaxID=76021 RepID=UPI0011775AD2|nr:hypothetical protein [Amycolatopsis coloradensis]
MKAHKRNGFDLSYTGSLPCVRPLAAPDVLRELAPSIWATQWIDTPAMRTSPEAADVIEDLAYSHAVRAVALVTLLADAATPEPRVVEALRERTFVTTDRYDDAGVPFAAAAAMNAATLLHDVVIRPRCPEPVRQLLRGRINTALWDRPGAAATLCADLAAHGGPKPVDGESLANRHYGARTCAALFASFLEVPTLRWPLAAAWAASTLATEWLDFADRAARNAGQTDSATDSLFWYGNRPSDQLIDAPMPTYWADVVGSEEQDSPTAG